MAFKERAGTTKEQDSQHYFGDNGGVIDFIDNISCIIEIDS